MLLVTGVSLLGIIAAIVMATALMFVRRVVRLDDQITAVAAAGGGGGVGYSGAEIPERKCFSRQ